MTPDACRRCLEACHGPLCDTCTRLTEDIAELRNRAREEDERRAVWLAKTAPPGVSAAEAETWLREYRAHADGCAAARDASIARRARYMLRLSEREDVGTSVCDVAEALPLPAKRAS